MVRRPPRKAWIVSLRQAEMRKGELQIVQVLRVEQHQTFADHLLQDLLHQLLDVGLAPHAALRERPGEVAEILRRVCAPVGLFHRVGDLMQQLVEALEVRNFDINQQGVQLRVRPRDVGQMLRAKVPKVPRLELNGHGRQQPARAAELRRPDRVLRERPGEVRERALVQLMKAAPHHLAADLLHQPVDLQVPGEEPREGPAHVVEVLLCEAGEVSAADLGGQVHHRLVEDGRWGPLCQCPCQITQVLRIEVCEVSTLDLGAKELDELFVDVEAGLRVGPCQVRDLLRLEGPQAPAQDLPAEVPQEPLQGEAPLDVPDLGLHERPAEIGDTLRRELVKLPFRHLGAYSLQDVLHFEDL
mmetsp:Transcript_71552/g.201973  ORF Transcript_71552/g.201973 Transcript_71552/m.201973 type:complete len:357 (+) Transcript_71552:731-1801(+)